jgi:hypothetical protein
LGFTRVGAEKTSQYGKIVFGVVDRLSRLLWGRPADPSRAFGLGSTVKLGKVGEPTLRSTYGLQSIKRGHPRPALLKVQTGIGQIEASLCGTDCDTECEPFLREALLVCCEPSVQFCPQAIEYYWILYNLAGKESLGEARYEDRIKRHAPGGFHRPNENRSIPLSGRRNADLQQKIRNHE